MCQEVFELVISTNEISFISEGKARYPKGLASSCELGLTHARNL